MTCKHEDFESDFTVRRIGFEGREDEVPHGFLVEISLRCAQCKEPFIFDWRGPADPDGLPQSITHIHRPYTTFARDTLCAPVLPQSRLEETLEARTAHSVLDPSPSASKH